MDVEKTIEFILQTTAQTAALQMKAEENFARHDAAIAQIDARLLRAIRLAVREERAERKRRQEMDARFELKMDRLASAHLLTEETIKRLGERIDKLIDTPGNGRPPRRDG